MKVDSRLFVEYVKSKTKVRYQIWLERQLWESRHKIKSPENSTPKKAVQQTHTKIANDIECAMDMLQPGYPPGGLDMDKCRRALHGIISQLR